jgi:hypothetical protein
MLLQESLSVAADDYTSRHVAITVLRLIFLAIRMIALVIILFELDRSLANPRRIWSTDDKSKNKFVQCHLMYYTLVVSFMNTHELGQLEEI